MKKSLREKALERLVKVDDGTIRCKVCLKNFKSIGYLNNHLQKQHIDEVGEAEDQIQDQEFMAELELTHKLVFDSVTRAKIRAENELHKALEKLEEENYKKGSLAYFFEHYAEDAIIAEETIRLLDEIEMVMNNTDGDRDPSWPWRSIAWISFALVEMKNEWRDEIISRFPRHNSTNEMSNIADRLKMSAKAKMVSDGWSKGFLSELVHFVRKLEKLADQL